MVSIMISNERKMAALLGVLPVLMDYMEDIREDYPRIYSKGVKKAGNDFIDEVEKLSKTVFGGVKDIDGSIEFFDEVQNISTAFNQWLAS
jgi:hypothetical protein